MKSKIVLFDENVLVAFKEQGVDFELFSSQAGSKAKEKFGADATAIFELSKEVGGLSIFALNNKTLASLTQQIATSDLELTFYAVVVGSPQSDRGGYSACVCRDKQTGLINHIPALNYGAMNFSFEYQVLEKVDKISLVKITGFVGEIEFLRFGLSDLGCPVFGDKDYKGDTLAKNTRMALTLAQMRFVMPNSDETVRSFVVVPEGKPWSFFDIDKWFKI